MIATNTNDLFDLLDEPWIPCERLDGRVEEFGLRDVLAHAHSLARISDGSPLVTIMLHRLLLAILDRALAPADRAAWVALWNAPVLPGAPIGSYFERWGHRFRLFDPARPFLQVVDLEKKLQSERGDPGERMLLWRMIIETSSHSSAAVHFERVPEDPRLSAAEAARGLLGFIGYAQGGRIQNEAASWKGGALRGGAAVLAMGADLRQTLLLNLLYGPRIPDDLPPWEREREIGRLERNATGPIDQLLFPVRRVQLFPQRDADGLSVRECITAAGERMADAPGDPQFAYFVRDKTKGPVALRFDEERAVWRDSTALFDAASGSDQNRPPLAVVQVSSLVVNGVLPRSARYRLGLFGMATDQARILLWRAEQVPLPASMLVDPDRVEALRSAIELAEQVGRGLDTQVLFFLCTRHLSIGDRKPDTKDVTALKSALGTLAFYWSSVGNDFPSWLSMLARVEDPETALDRWKIDLRTHANAAFQDAASRLGERARAHIAEAEGRKRLNLMLHEFIPRQPRSTATEIQGEPR
ncbi:MAG: type I-E CRISPR-associated protein Cse1/CasA [Polyangiaceae bacterium]